MKLLYLTCLCILTFSLRAASQIRPDNFLLANGDIEWRKTCSSHLSLQNIYSNARMSFLFQSIDSANGTISGYLKPFLSDYKAAGKNRNNTALYLQNSLVSGYFMITQKGTDSVVISISRITLIANNDYIGTQQGEQTMLREFALNNNGQFRPNFIKLASEVLDNNFSRIFTLF